MRVSNRESDELGELVGFATSACRAAASVLARQEKLGMAERAHDVKAQADVEADEAIRDVLVKSGIPILSEESGRRELSGRVWIVDPLDGTVNYLKGNPLNCVSIAMWDGECIPFGVVYDFRSDDIYIGGRDLGATCNGLPIVVSSAKESSKSVLLTGFPSGRSYQKEDLSGFVQKVQSFRKIRLLGSAALSLCWVSRSWADAYMEEDIYLWDVAAGVALVEGAGGAVDMGEIDAGSMKLTVVAASTRELLCEMNGAEVS